MAGTWKLITNQPPASVDTMLLLTDGFPRRCDTESHSVTPNVTPYLRILKLGERSLKCHYRFQ